MAVRNNPNDVRAMLNLKTKSASSRSGTKKQWQWQLDAHSKELELESYWLEQHMSYHFTKAATGDKPRQLQNHSFESATIVKVINVEIV